MRCRSWPGAPAFPSHLAEKKLRQYPPEIGVTSLGVCERNETIGELAMDFLKSLCYRRPIDMDFRYDERDCEQEALLRTKFFSIRLGQRR